MKRVRIGMVTVGLLALLAGDAFAGAPTDFVKGKTDEVTKLLTSKATKKRSEDLRKFLSSAIDFRELAARSLGKHWEARTPEEQQKFLDLLQELIRANYETQLEGRTLGKDYQISYIDEKTRDAKAIVKTTVEVRGEKKPIDYKLAEKEGQWSVFDVVIDDISLEETYRDSYVEIIEDEGWASLIKRMEEKVAEVRKADKKKK
ncbi:MAG: ABC transporter substrate-binding protein [bacterium]